MLIQNRSLCGDGEKGWTCWTGAGKDPLINPSELGVTLDIGNINRFRYQGLESKVVKWVLCRTDT